MNKIMIHRRSDWIDHQETHHKSNIEKGEI